MRSRTEGGRWRGFRGAKICEARLGAGLGTNAPITDSSAARASSLRRRSSGLGDVRIAGQPVSCRLFVNCVLLVEG